MSMAIPNRVYEDFEPPSDLVKDQGCDTILIYLPGFRKDQLKVQLTPSHVLKVSGERPIGDKKWRRFQKEFVVPTNCDSKEITAKFEGGILHIRQPKLITPTPPEQQVVTQEPKSEHKPPVIAPLPPPTESQPRAQTQTQTHQPQPQSQTPTHKTQPQSQPQSRPELKLPSPLPSIPEERAKEKREEETVREETRKISNKGKEHVSEDKGDQTSAGQTQKVVAAGIGLFKELRNPDNQKRIANYALMIIFVAFYVLRLFKSLTRTDQESVVEYDKEL